MTAAAWLSLDEATTRIAGAAHAVVDTEVIALQQAQGRVLASDLVAQLDVPPWDNAGMDGYAVATRDITSASLPIQGVITAGLTDIPALQPGHCLRIMTGAPLPSGADAVVMQENTEKTDGGIRFLQPPEQGESIRRRGSDVARGDVLINAGTVLNAAHLMVIASQGLNSVTVLRKVRVGIVTTGDELVAPGGKPESGQIFDANRTGLTALLSPLPVEITDYGIVKDEPEQLKSVFSDAAQTQDVLLSSGGVSVGDADFVKPVLSDLGDVNFWKVAIKPGKPFAFGQLGKTLFCGVPGNPVSAYVTTQMLVLPLINRLSGNRQSAGHIRLNAILSASIRRRAGRLEFMRARYETDANGRLRVTALPRQSSSVMTSVTQANCYLVVSAETEMLAQDSSVEIIPFNQPGLM